MALYFSWVEQNKCLTSGPGKKPSEPSLVIDQAQSSFHFFNSIHFVPLPISSQCMRNEWTHQIRFQGAKLQNKYRCIKNRENRGQSFDRTPLGTISWWGGAWMSSVGASGDGDFLCRVRYPYADKNTSFEYKCEVWFYISLYNTEVVRNPSHQTNEPKKIMTIEWEEIRLKWNWYGADITRLGNGTTQITTQFHAQG